MVETLGLGSLLLSPSLAVQTAVRNGGCFIFIFVTSFEVDLSLGIHTMLANC